MAVQILVILTLSVALSYCVRLYLEFRSAIRGIQNHPGLRIFVDPAGILGSVLPPLRGVSVGCNSSWERKHTVYGDIDCDIHSVVSAWPKARANILLADADVIKEVTSSRARFPKPVHLYTVLSFLGRNIIASEGEEWKRFRKISAPAFSDRNSRFVCEETRGIMLDMFENVWNNQDEVSFEHCGDVTMPIVFYVICVAGFGRRVSWNDDTKVPPGHQMTFKDVIHTVSSNVFFKLLIPNWGMRLTKKLRRIQLAFDELESYILEMIEARRSLGKAEARYDLFSSLLDASDSAGLSDDGMKMTDSELVGNIFAFLIAGHETAAHTLCFTFALLALYQDEQEILYRHIKKIIPNDRLFPTHDEMPLLTQCLAVLYETLRMFPPATLIPKYSAEDTVLVGSNAAGQKISISCPKGTDICINVPGLHFNPRYWQDPFTFKPSRFLGNWPHDAFVSFSAGSRACLGRKFFETEGVAILAILMLRYKIEVMEEPQFASESFEERKARVLETRPGITLTPVRVPVTFKRRC